MENLTIDEQIKLLKKRNMKIENEKEAKYMLGLIGYYRFKSFARVFENNSDEKIKYRDNTTFEMVLDRYYQNKNIRMNLLHAIEKIEVALKNKIVSIFGDNFGEYGYLDFSKWKNKENYTKLDYQIDQLNFKKKLLIYKSKDKLFNITDEYCDDEGIPNVWIAINLLTFGDINIILNDMDDSLVVKIARDFKCSVKELRSWVDCLVLVRNICCHNSNLLDISLERRPKSRRKWKAFLYVDRIKSKDIVTNKLALIIVITLYMVNSIKEDYNWIYDANIGLIPSIKLICSDDNLARKLGFKQLNSIDLMYNFLLKKPIKVIVDMSPTIQFEFDRLDDNGKSLVGSTICLTDKETNSIISEIVTQGSIIEFCGLIIEKVYILSETMVSEEYKLASPIEFKINKEGLITILPDNKCIDGNIIKMKSEKNLN